MKKSLFSNYYFWAAVITFVVATFVIKGNLISFVRASHTIKLQQRQIEKYEAEIRELDGRISARISDKDSLETYARERYHFAEKGDDVYLVEK